MDLVDLYSQIQDMHAITWDIHIFHNSRNIKHYSLTCCSPPQNSEDFDTKGWNYGEYLQIYDSYERPEEQRSCPDRAARFDVGIEILRRKMWKEKGINEQKCPDEEHMV